MKSTVKCIGTVLMTLSMVVSSIPLNVLQTNAAVKKPKETLTVDDMIVASSIYGWALNDAKENTDGSVSVTIMRAGHTKEETFTTALKYGISNAMTGSSQAGAIKERCKKGTFVEICLNEEQEVIDIHRVLQAGMSFDTARFGGDLTAIGSEVSERGAQYEDEFNDNENGPTGVFTGDSGRMVSYGWLLRKNAEDRTITVGDGNRETDVFNETYHVADDVKVYRVANGNDGKYVSTQISFNGEPIQPITPVQDVENNTTTDDEFNEEASASVIHKASNSNIKRATESETTKDHIYGDDEYLADVDPNGILTPSKLDEDGLIYNTSSEDRHQVVVIFDADYTHYHEDGSGDAVVKEIYELDTPVDVSAFVGKVPQSVRTMCDLSNKNQGNPHPSRAPYLVSANPITVVDGKMWTVGDIEDNCPIFRGGDDLDGDGEYQLVQFDTGWPLESYQYMRNIEKTGNDPRELDMILIPHGHGDHYGSAYDEWETVVRSGEGKNPIVYESYEDTIGFDIHGFPEIKGIYNDQPVRSIITNWYPNDQWISLGDGLNMMITLTPGHSQGCGSAVFDVEVQNEMKDAKLTYEYDPDSPEADSEGYIRSYSDYEPGDHIQFAYMGGYGINGLSNLSAGFRRNAFVASLRYIESVFSNLDVPGEKGRKADGVYNLAQHTNQYPYTETSYVMSKYNDENDTDYSFLHFMREGRDEIINFCEKRASAILYNEYTKQYMEQYDKKGAVPFYDFDGIHIKTDITSTSIKDSTIEDIGPYKHSEGEHEITLADDVDVLVMHGYDVYLNKGVVPEDAGMKTNDVAIGIADANWNLVKGFAFAKDGFVYDPDKWYVQIGARVNDDYDGNVYSNQGINEGLKFTSGPVESFRENWCELLRTEAMSKEEAEQLAVSLRPGATYKVNIKKTGDIINNKEDVFKTFALVEDDQENNENKPNDQKPVLPADQDNVKYSSHGSIGGSSRSSSTYSSNIVDARGKAGTWKRDEKGWWFSYSDNTYPVNKWEKLFWQGNYSWYHFDKDGYCQGGWFTDIDGATYYLHNAHDGRFGEMHIGWNQIDGNYYYLEPVAGKLQGHLYKDMITPDGYRVDNKGVWKK